MSDDAPQIPTPPEPILLVMSQENQDKLDEMCRIIGLTRDQFVECMIGNEYEYFQLIFTEVK